MLFKYCRWVVAGPGSCRVRHYALGRSWRVLGRVMPGTMRSAGCGGSQAIACQALCAGPGCRPKHDTSGWVGSTVSCFGPVREARPIWLPLNLSISFRYQLVWPVCIILSPKTIHSSPVFHTGSIPANIGHTNSILVIPTLIPNNVGCTGGIENIFY